MAAEAFAALAAAHSSFAGMSYDTLGMKGALIVDAPKPAAVGAGA
jgi:hypothetical protein